MTTSETCQCEYVNGDWRCPVLGAVAITVGKHVRFVCQKHYRLLWGDAWPAVSEWLVKP